jgi:hypothetical protein
MLQTIWEWIVFVYVECLIIPILQNPIPFYLTLGWIGMCVALHSWVAKGGRR